jgi:hypothetical protein
MLGESSSVRSENIFKHCLRWMRDVLMLKKRSVYSNLAFYRLIILYGVEIYQELFRVKYEVRSVRTVRSHAMDRDTLPYRGNVS